MVAGHSLTLITAADCHLCEHARRVLTSVSREMAVVVREVGWESEQGRALAKLDGVPFPPAVYVNGVLAGYGRISERALRKRLGEAPA